MTIEEEIEGLGLLDVITTPGAKRLVGDIAVKSPLFDLPMTGFENHSSVTTLSTGIEPFGRVLTGTGNGIAGLDGAIYKNIFGTYLHGLYWHVTPNLLICCSNERSVSHSLVLMMN
ncbi:MAG: hypothetical protein WDN07_00215 [Actinomycetota bacterium]